MNKKKILILGGGGMFGHKAYQILSKEFNTWATFRDFVGLRNGYSIFEESKVLDQIDAFSINSVKRAFEVINPDVVINCIGLIKQHKNAKNHKLSVYLNSLFPHLLADMCEYINARLVHISTDCVFSGKKGFYSEKDNSDAEDLYGRTKFLGEIERPNVITIRTSIIGHELSSNVSLVDWFLSQSGEKVRGYLNAIYTGLPTITLARELAKIIIEYNNLEGLYQISTTPISKYDLLKLINTVYKCSIQIEPFKEFICDRSLDFSKYKLATGYQPPSWSELINEMYDDYRLTAYRKKKRVYEA